MTTILAAATSTTGAVLDPSVGDGQLIIKTGATAGAQVNALSFAADGTPTFPQLPQTLATSGTAKLAGGLVLKWGTFTNNATANTAQAVTFATAFPTACVSVVATIVDNGNNTVRVFSLTVSGFNAYASAGSLPANYIAIGY